MKSKDNFATEGLSGTYKQVVFRQLDGQTYVAKRPVFTKPPTQQQLDIRDRFRLAISFAKAITSDPAMKEAYKKAAKKRQSAFNRAFMDFFSSPEIGELDTSGYNGQVGGTVIATVTDDFRVASVKARIELNGVLLEEGDATLLPDGINWIYVSTVANGSLTGTSIRFTAEDLPRHSVSKTKTL